MKITVMYFNAGGGHMVAARNAAKELEDCGHVVELIDVASFSPKLIGWCCSSWKFFLNYPTLHHHFHTIFDGRIEAMVTNAATTIFSYTSKGFLENCGSDIVLCTHFSVARSMMLHKRALEKKGVSNLPRIVLLCTEFRGHRVWLQDVDELLVFTASAKRDFLDLGFPKKKISEIAFPLKDMKKTSPAVARKKLSLPNKKTILILSGAEGKGPVLKQVQSYLAADLSAQILVICGRNNSLQKKLSAINDARLRVYGFVDNIVDFYNAADIVVGKTGTLVTLELASLQKPFLITQVMGNETGARDFVLKNKLGWEAQTIQEQIIFLKKFLSGDVKFKPKNVDLQEKNSVTEHIVGYSTK